MKLNFIERLITNSPLRALSQRWIEAPLLKALAERDDYLLCLEIGCGRGAGAEIIAREFHAGKVIAVDADPSQIERARKGLEPGLRDIVEFRVADAMALDEPDSKFDAVFSFGVLHHMEDWRKALAEAARVLKPGGEIFFIEVLRPFLQSFPVRMLTAHPEGGMFTDAEFETALAELGLKITGVRRLGGAVMYGAARKRP